MMTDIVKKSSRVYVAGHAGLVGSAVVRHLKTCGYTNVITADRADLDLEIQNAVQNFFQEVRPSYVILAAARVGGIMANVTEQSEFLYSNMMIQNNVIKSAVDVGVEKLVFLGSSCIYPKHAPQPLREDFLLTGPLEPTNEGYALAKIAGLKLCEMLNKQKGLNFISIMPTNLYGPGDNFHPTKSHVIPGLLRRFHEAKIKGDEAVTVWGTGTPRREFLYVEDLASGIVHALENYNDHETINIGTGQDTTIAELAQIIKEVAGYSGALRFDASKPDGTPRKVLDVSKIKALGWSPSIDLHSGLKTTYDWCVANRIFE